MNENTIQSLASIPTAGFQSTSSMRGSGSVYASTPSLNSDGRASYSPTAMETTPGGPNYIAPPTPGGNPTPIGDAAWFMLFLTLLYTVRLIKRFNTQITHKK